MARALRLKYDPEIVDVVASAFALRESNVKALHKLIHHLSGLYEPEKQQVMHMATGAGKTYVMAAFIEYLRRLGHRNVVIITPGLIVQSKTVLNFTPGSPKFIGGYDAGEEPNVFTPQTLHEWGLKQDQNSLYDPINLFIFNIDQLLRPASTDGTASTSGGIGEQQRGVRKTSEVWGNVFEYLQNDDELVIIADEAHSYSLSAVKRHQAIQDLDATTVIGLTATTDPHDENIEIIYKYPLYQAIKDSHVKRPVIAFRRGGYKDGAGNFKEELQLRDAKMLLNRKTDAYQRYIAENDGVTPVHPVLFVVCADVNHAKSIESYLASPEMFGIEERILRIDNTTKDSPAVLEALNSLDTADSPIRAVVSVNMLKEGWDVKNVAVICSLRASASEVLTQQTMGRGLRLPFGKLTGDKDIDQLDILSHEAFENMLNDEGIREAFDLAEALPPKKKDLKPKSPKPTKLGADSDNPSDSSGDRLSAGDEYSKETSGRSSSNLGAGTAGEGVADGGATTTNVETEGHIDFTGAEGGVEEFDEDDFSDEEKDKPAKIIEPVKIHVNEEYKGLTFYFPATVFQRERASNEVFTPAKVEDRRLIDLARTVTGTGAVIDRKLLAISNKMKLIANKTVSAEGYAEEIPGNEVVEALTNEIYQSQVFARTDVNRRLAKAKVRTFVAAVTVKWTAASVFHAEDLLLGEFRATARSLTNNFHEVRVLNPHPLPIASSFVVPDKEMIRERSDDFIRKAPVQGYLNGLFPVAAFDAKATEFQIAELLEASGSVQWWKRLYDADKASIAWGKGQKYHPDFVVCEGDHYWIVEGKRSDEVDSDEVQAKAEAARESVSMTPESPLFDGQTWHYVLLDEKQVAMSSDWDDLKKYEYAYYG